MRRPFLFFFDEVWQCLKKKKNSCGERLYVKVWTGGHSHYGPPLELMHSAAAAANTVVGDKYGRFCFVGFFCGVFFYFSSFSGEFGADGLKKKEKKKKKKGDGRWGGFRAVPVPSMRWHLGIWYFISNPHPCPPALPCSPHTSCSTV